MTSPIEKAKENISVDSLISMLNVQKKAGNIVWVCCPFHGEKTASMKVDASNGKFHCFGCEEKGDALDLYMKINGITETADALEELLGSEYKKNSKAESLIYSINAEAAAAYHSMLMTGEQAEAARSYLSNRGLHREFAEKYQIGYAPDSWDFICKSLAGKFADGEIERAGLSAKKKGGGCYDRFRARIMFPIYDHRGRVCAFSGRVISDEKPKYLNSPETEVFSKSKTLFGFHQHKEEISASRQAVVVEGNFDLVLLAANGIGNTVAPLGTALTKEHVHALCGRCDEAVLLFDGDAAGMRAARKSVPLFLAEGLEARAAVLPEGHDPDSFVRAHGADSLRSIISAAEHLPEFALDSLVKEHGLTLAGKYKILEGIDEITAEIKDQTRKAVVSVHFRSLLESMTGYPAREETAGAAAAENELEIGEEEERLIEFLLRNKHISSGILDSYQWSSDSVKLYAKNKLGFSSDAEAASCEVSVEDVEQAIDNKNSLTLEIPESISNPGGLISLGMKGLSVDGLPKYPQLSLPVVLSVIGQAMCKHVSIGSKIPAFYAARIAPSQIGKSEGSDAMIYALRAAGLSDMIGPSKLQSGQSIIRALSQNRNMLCFCDEGAKMFAGDKYGRDSNSKTMIETLLTLFTQNGSRFTNAYSDAAKNVELDWFAFGLCANAVPDVLDDISVASLSNGLITRLNFFCYDGPILQRGIADTCTGNKDLKAFAEKIAIIFNMDQSNSGDKLRGGATSLSISKVRGTLQDISDETVRRCNENLHDNIRTSIIGQVFDMTLRFAMVHIGSSREAWEIAEPVTEADIAYGYRLARLLTDWKLDVLIRRVSGSEFEEQCNVFYDGVVTCHARYLSGKSKSRASIATISERKKKAKWPLKTWTEIINYMEETDRISVERKGAKMFFSPVIK